MHIQYIPDTLVSTMSMTYSCSWWTQILASYARGERMPKQLGHAHCALCRARGQPHCWKLAHTANDAGACDVLLVARNPKVHGGICLRTASAL
jgi:hypothetical protein